VISDQEAPALKQVLSEDEKLVDVLLAVGVRPDIQDNLSSFITQLSRVVQSRAQDGEITSILINSDVTAPEKPGNLDLFQVHLELDLQHFFTSIVEAAHHAAVVDPNSHTMLISRDAFEDEGLQEPNIFLSLPPWHFPSM
jgi:hypothetical protein